MYKGALHITLAVCFSVFLSTSLRAEGGGGGIASALPMIGAVIGQSAAAAIQAQADVDVTAINANAQTKQTETTSETAKYLSDSQSSTSLYNSLMSLSINRDNNQTQTANLDKVLDFRRWSEMLNSQARSQKRADDMKIALANIQVQRELMQTQVAAKAAELRAQTLINGLSTGVTTAALGAASTARLSVSRIFSPKPLAGAAQIVRNVGPRAWGATRNSLRRAGVSSRLTLPLRQATILGRDAVAKDLKKFGNALTGIFSKNAASGSSRSVKRRTDLESFQEQSRTLASVGSQDLRPHRSSAKEAAGVHDHNHEHEGRQAHGEGRPIRTIGGGVAEE
jgi:hypothetical protein